MGNEPLKAIDRRDFLKLTGAAGAALVAAASKIRVARAESGLQIINPEQNGVFAGFNIAGVPPQVDRSIIKIAGVHPDAKEQKNTLGNNTDFMVAEPGVRTSNGYIMNTDGSVVWDMQALKGESCFLISPFTQGQFDHEPPAFTPLLEDGYNMLTGAYMDFEVQGNNGPIKVNLEGIQGHSWFAIVRGAPADGLPDTDNNRVIKMTKHNPGFTGWTKLPFGQFVSEDYLKQNVEAAHDQVPNTGNCGVSGCTKVSVMLIDQKSGAYTVIGQNGINAPWELRKSNII